MSRGVPGVDFAVCHEGPSIGMGVAAPGEAGVEPLTDRGTGN